MIEVSELRKAGVEYSSTKLAQLGGMITKSIKTRTQGKYIVKGRVKGKKLRLTVKKKDEKTGKYKKATEDEETLLAGRIAKFLNNQGISAKIQIR